MKPDKHVSIAYDYRELEAAVGPEVAWLLINPMCHDDKIEYGTSPRFGWLTESGKALAEFMAKHTVDELCEMGRSTEADCICYPDHCNCDAYDESAVDCRPLNPFWRKQ